MNCKKGDKVKELLDVIEKGILQAAEEWGME